MIKIFDSTATSFETNGFGYLADCSQCIVQEERNGVFEVEFLYPIFGRHYDHIALRNIVVCKPNPYSDEQPFRIYEISKPINGVVTVNAAHISYDLSGIIVSPFTADGLGQALLGIKNNSVTNNPFTFSTDKTNASTKYTVKVPKSARALLGGTEGSILDIFGTGEYIFDNYNVRFMNHRGEDRGVTIRYGKNLTDLKQEENCANVCTGIYPYWYSDNDGLVELSSKIINLPGTFNFVNILPLDLSAEWTEKPTEQQLIDKTNAYISNNDLGKPDVSLDVSFIQLEQSEEYETLQLLERVSLCDTVTVIFPELGVESVAKCIETRYNVITDKYISLKLGKSIATLSSTIAKQSDDIANAPTKTFMEQAIDNATKIITGDKGGYVVFHDTNGDKQPDEILIMDTPDINTAIKLWRWNRSGLGYSSNGYNGPYAEFAVTEKGTLHATNVKAEGIEAGTIKAALTIIGATIQNAENNPSFRVDSSGNIRGGSISIPASNPKFSVSASGDINAQSGTFSGTVSGATITGGTISGTSISGGTISGGSISIPASSPQFTVDSSGKLTANSGTFKGTVSGGTISGGSIKIPASSPKFQVDSGGNIKATSAQLTNATLSGSSTSIDVYGGFLNLWSAGGSGWFHIDANNKTNAERGYYLDLGPQKCANSDGNSGSYYTQLNNKDWFEKVNGDSDLRLKTNVKELDKEFSEELILGTKVHEFEFIRTPGEICYGVIAQEVLEQLDKFGLTEENSRFIQINPSKEYDTTYGIRYEQYIPHLINVIQIQNGAIESLQKQINDLREEKV